MSLDSKTKVVPIYIKDTYNLRYFKYWLQRPEILLKIGKPIAIYNYAKDGNNLEQMAEIVREKIIDLIDVKQIQPVSDLNSFDQTLITRDYKSNQRDPVGKVL